ncbi:V-set domain-containing T-cell activation inhibitor 1-like, partial [Poeciliopsis prolifica]|uniref:V-set domain-containing T-cell activation inhibitor 1-like n=1 Tax=Poeciliopsis prolifica TaxID=188132 RepID=UPI002414157B
MEDALQTGDLSLTLRKPTFTDSGTFTCTVRRLGEELHQEVVELQVKEAPPVWPWVLVVLVVLVVPVVLVVLVVLVVAAVGLMYRLKKRLTAVLPSETVEIREGLKSVLLPVKTQKRLHSVRVEWSRPGQRNVTVHVSQNGQTQSEQQEDVYRGRTKMKTDLQDTGDFSLTLRVPQIHDSGVYDCLVSRGGEKLLQKTVTLRVKESLMEEVEVADRDAFVRLPFQTAADLPADSKVVWSRTDQQNSVHEYQNHHNQPDRQNQEYLNRTQMSPDALRTGNLTLTLNDPRLADSGVFICTVYNDQDGTILKRKVLMLNVKVHQVDKVSVEEG